MFHQTPTPRLIQLYFGEHAESTWLIASERLKRWCEAFDDWVEKYQSNSSQYDATQTWKKLINDRHQMPWMMTKVDIEQHIVWMKSTRYAAGSIDNSLRYISSFYRWCNQKRVDPECGANFNPAEGVERPKFKKFEGSKLLSREEIDALLGIAQKDKSPLGKRDHAFLLARLRLGVPLPNLQRLQWKMIEQGEHEVRVCWKPGAEAVLLPDDVWQAIRDYLSASGRLESMQGSSYIFSPQVKHSPSYPQDQKEAWVEGKYLSVQQLLYNLKVYGRAAFIDEEKLTVECLRKTAIRLKLNEGLSLEEMQVFMLSKV